MARTAIVNPRRKKAKKRRTRKYGRRRNPSTSLSSDRSYNPRRRRRARRRNPAAPAKSIYSSGGYRRRNPAGDLFDFDNITEKMPAATLGVMAARFAMKMAGPFEPNTKGGPNLPGIKHAIAMVLGAHFGAQFTGSMLGNGKALFAECGALGFAGDLFTRTRLLNDSPWAQENLYLNGPEDDADGGYEEGISGFEDTSALGAGEYVVGPDGTLYQMSGTPVATDPAYYPGGNTLIGFEDRSALASAESSFGYARR